MKQFLWLFLIIIFCITAAGPTSDVVPLTVAIKSLLALDQINEDLQLERSGRIGPAAARKLTNSAS